MGRALFSRIVTERKQRTDPDFDLIGRCRDVRDEAFEAAFEALYMRYRDRVYSIAYRMTGTATDAMDVVQESFSVLFRKISSFRFDSLFSTWLFRIVVNCSIDYRRREESRRSRTPASLSSLGAGAEPSDPSPDPIASAQASELGDHVHASLQRLSPKLRAIVILRYLEGLSYEELAAALQISLGTVKSRLARAHVALEQVLAGTRDQFGERRAAGPGGVA